METKTALINVFKSCLNILRDNEGLTGEKALRNLSYLLILKLLEPRFATEIDIDNFEYDFSDYDVSNNQEDPKTLLLRMVRFSNLVNEREGVLPNVIKCIWDVILSVHPSTNKVFLNGKGFDIQHQSTYKKLIDKLHTLPNTDHDILGNAYEEVIQDIMTGKVLGQFFTQPVVKKMMVKLINPQIHPDGKIDTCGDPTMGTGGFLITYLQEIMQQSKTKNITPDWDFIKTEGLYGKELEPDTYQLAVSNMLISSGHMFHNLDRGDSIRDPITRKFDTILANPPFGIKGLKYDDFQSSLKFQYTPIKTDNAVSLFIQAIIYMLKIDGRCAVVLPDGQDLFSKTNKTLVAIREYLMKTCDLQEIIYLPAGIFTYTTIKTCVFYFVKKSEGTEVMETNIKVSKTQKETGRNYKFTKTHQTTSIKFYDYNPIEEEKTFLVEVLIEDIENNKYSLNYTEYIKNEKRKDYEESIVIKTLGEICTFLPKSKRQASYGNKEGLYPFYTSSPNCSKYCDEYDYEDECIIIGTGGNANIKYSNKFSCSTDNFVLKSNQSTVLIKYLYYYLSTNIELLENGFIGVGIKHISKDYIYKLEIPIPSIENQNKIVNYLDFIYETTIKTSHEKIEQLNKLNEFCLTNQKMFGDNIIKNLSDIIKYKSGKRLPQGHQIQNNITPYPYIRITDIDKNTISLSNIKYISQETKDIINKYIITTDDIYITIAGTTGLVGIIPNELNGANLTENAVRINIINKNEILQKYLVYDIHYNQKEELKTKTIGAAIPKLSIERLMTLQIPIPPIERQQEIIEYCDNNNTLIKQLEKEIEDNKKQTYQFITSIIKKNKKDDIHPNKVIIKRKKINTPPENLILS